MAIVSVYFLLTHMKLRPQKVVFSQLIQYIVFKCNFLNILELINSSEGRIELSLGVIVIVKGKD